MSKKDLCNINNIVLYLLLVVYIATILLIMGNEKRTRARKARSRAVDKKAIEEGKRRRRDGGSSSKSQEVEGTISAVLAGTMFKVKLANGHELLAHSHAAAPGRTRLGQARRCRCKLAPGYSWCSRAASSAWSRWSRSRSGEKPGR